MKRIYLILSILVIIIGALWFIIGNAVNTIICTTVMIPQLGNPEFDIVLHFENCGR